MFRDLNPRLATGHHGFAMLYCCQELITWFHALDVDNSGTVEEDEIRALMHAMGVEVQTSRHAQMHP